MSFAWRFAITLKQALAWILECRLTRGMICEALMINAVKWLLSAITRAAGRFWHVFIAPQAGAPESYSKTGHRRLNTP